MGDRPILSQRRTVLVQAARSFAALRMTCEGSLKLACSVGGSSIAPTIRPDMTPPPPISTEPARTPIATRVGRGSARRSPDRDVRRRGASSGDRPPVSPDRLVRRGAFSNRCFMSSTQAKTRPAKLVADPLQHHVEHVVADQFDGSSPGESTLMAPSRFSIVLPSSVIDVGTGTWCW